MSPTRAFPASWTRRKVAVALVAIGAVLVVVGALVGIAWAATIVSQVRNTQLDGTPQGKKLLRASDQIISCTTPEGECTQANQRATAALVADLATRQKQNAADAAACGALPSIMVLTDPDERAAAILSCMEDVQKQRHR